jgi:hypothetical protein
MRQCGQAALAILDELGVQRAAFLGVRVSGDREHGFRRIVSNDFRGS